MSRATLAFFCLPFSWSIIFHLLTLNLCLSSELNLLNSAYRWVLFLNTSSHSVSFDWWYQSIYLGLSQTDKYIALFFFCVCVWFFFFFFWLYCIFFLFSVFLSFWFGDFLTIFSPVFSFFVSCLCSRFVLRLFLGLYKVSHRWYDCFFFLLKASYLYLPIWFHSFLLQYFCCLNLFSLSNCELIVSSLSNWSNYYFWCFSFITFML